jgi:ribosome-binding factor A
MISEKIKLRFMPEIIFKIDESLEHTKQVHDILDKLKKEKSDEAGDRGDTKA